MKFTKIVEIKKPVSLVWRTMATDFDQASIWMASVQRSYAKSERAIAKNAPMHGRICHLSSSDTKNMVDETIAEFDESHHIFRFEVVPLNMPAIFPFHKNKVVITMTKLADGGTEMRWDLDVHLRLAGLLLYPLVKVGLSKGIDNIIGELKFYVENGHPHPRKKSPAETSPPVAA
jgi:polyketide cyclase/dehydrase/lipid transport protein